MEGVINLDKPAGLTSARAVGRVKRLLPRGTKIGHAGTLDPFATGVLLLLVGKATKRSESLMNSPKQYEATLKFGATTETLDPDSPEILAPPIAPPHEQSIRDLLPRFIGEIQQLPPAYSALKINGRPAYELARKGKEINLEPRPVRIYGIELIQYAWPFLSLRIDCGRGTYIRSLARDIGDALGTAAYLTSLRRTRVGEYHASAAVALDAVLADGIERYLSP